ncbi:MAG: M28 family peptidase [Bacteroidota bacterium]
MKKIVFGLLAIQLLIGKVYAQPMATALDKATEYAETITAADLAKHLRIIASDSLQGRDTGEIGQKMAADYIAYQFFDYGIQPLITKENGSSTYFQSIDLVKTQMSAMSLTIAGQPLAFPTDFLPLGNRSINDTLRAPIVFAGYGLETPKYSDYAKTDVKGKVAFILLGEPSDKQGTGEKRVFNWRETFQAKEQLALQKGAKLVFFIDELGEVFQRDSSRFANYARRAQLGFKKQPQSFEPLSLFISLPMAARVLGVSEKKLLKQISRLRNQKPSKIKETEEIPIQLRISRDEIPVVTENVLGLVEGSDKKEEVVVITAHYDHLGMQGKVVYNGANDDGSGTVAVLELAQAFAKAKSEGNGPRRSILFMAVTGEEKGLLGSAYYTSHPILPLSNTIADLNIDMIGRVDDAHKDTPTVTTPDYIYVIGSDKLSSELHQINEEANLKYTHLNLDYRFNDPNDPNRFYYRSDHYNFAKYKIPVAFYFNGVHEDYHQPTDDVEKIDFGKAEKVSRLVFYTAWELANREQRIKVDSAKP